MVGIGLGTGDLEVEDLQGWPLDCRCRRREMLKGVEIPTHPWFPDEYHILECTGVMPTLDTKRP